jgi:putative flippase GtrA
LAVTGSRRRGGDRTRRTSKTAEPVKFLLVGFAGYVATLATFAFLYGGGVSYAPASFVSYLGANALMYLGNRYFTFGLGHDGFWSAYRRYVLVGVFVAVLNALILGVLVERGIAEARAGQAISLLVVTPVAFVLFKRWTFGLRTV